MSIVEVRIFKFQKNAKDTFSFTLVQNVYFFKIIIYFWLLAYSYLVFLWSLKKMILSNIRKNQKKFIPLCSWKFGVIFVYLNKKTDEFMEWFNKINFCNWFYQIFQLKHFVFSFFPLFINILKCYFNIKMKITLLLY